MKLILFFFLFVVGFIQAQPLVFLEKTNTFGDRWHVTGLNVSTNELWAIRGYTDVDDVGFTLPNQSFEFGKPDAIVPNTPRMFFKLRFIRRVSTNNFVFVDASNGNDETAKHSSFIKPYKTLNAASLASNTGDDIILSFGDYYALPSLTLNNKNLIGRDMNLTRVLGGASGSSIILNISGSTYISDVTVESTNKSGQFVFNLQTSSLTPKDIILNRIRVIGDSDGISIGGGTSYVNFAAYDSEFLTHYDAVICSSSNTNSVYRLYNCKVETVRDPKLFGGTVRSVAVVNTKVYLIGCSLLSSNGVDNSLGVYNRTGDVFLVNTKISATSTSGIVKVLFQEGGRTVISGARYGEEQISNQNGQIIYQ
jgi:hypothetical protein